MGKKNGAKSKAKSAAAEAPKAAAAPPRVDEPKSWEETLELHPFLKQQEEEKAAERQRKAEAAAAETQRQNERREQWLKQKSKEERKQRQEDNKWQSEVAKAKARAEKEGILEAWEYDDGTFWVELGGGLWKECKGSFFCTHCEKHLNDCTLQSHMESEAHRKKLAWQQGASAPGAAPACPPATPSAPPRPSGTPQQAAPPGQPRRPGQLPEWQQMRPDGLIQCLPCSKVYDECHGATRDHESRLEYWLHQKDLERKGYPAPAQPHLAWVPSDEQDPTSERWLKCLLCGKYVQDETSHAGTHANPIGSKDHVKNLRNCSPNDAWYRDNVTKLRLKWHPSTVVAPSERVPKAPANGDAQRARLRGWRRQWGRRPRSATGAAARDGCVQWSTARRREGAGDDADDESMGSEGCRAACATTTRSSTSPARLDCLLGRGPEGILLQQPGYGRDPVGSAAAQAGARAGGRGYGRDMSAADCERGAVRPAPQCTT
eukprot:CAMPEP_0176175238 /NCGR_PEP_ID=MMETSP0120_2-20121206/89775_1 /TAXON_ID=160619 /ORGANISM="Kryptoperidinium foliaceum, Strain CCMP 1326" /LENGTH=488 /DNA_ID=CAMNT_0017513283 /DNA_START=53 /DNA_END=1517 /DNA_ORIENTATION=-